MCAVYLGLGKLLLNGCELYRTTVDYRIVSYSQSTESLETGYLSLSELAFSYAIICMMRRIPNERVYGRLNVSASSAVKRLMRLYGAFSDVEANPIDEKQRLLKKFGEETRHIRQKITEIQRMKKEIQTLLDRAIESFC